MNDNLGDFLRKKLEDFDGTVDSWDKPDSSVKNNILQQIVIPAAAAPNYRKYGLIALLMLLSLFLGAYIWYLQKENKVLKTALLEQEQRLEKANTTITDLGKQVDEKAKWQQAKENLETKKQVLINENKERELIIQEQQKRIFEFNYKNVLPPKNVFSPFREGEKKAFFRGTEPLHSLKQYQKDEAGEKERSEKGSLFNPIFLTPLPQKELVSTAAELEKLVTPPPVLSATLPATIKRKQFEFGLEYGLLGFDFLLENEFKELSETSPDKKGKEIFSAAKSGYFAYSPKKNWWLKTGIRTADISIEQNLTFGAVYDEKGEYIKPNGARGNRLTLRSTNVYSETESNINVEIPNGVSLETGDLIISELTSYQKMQLTQIPIGVEYRFGEKRLHWHLEGGTQWNKMKFGEYLVDGKIEAKNKALLIDKIETKEKDAGEKQFWGIYGGIGLNYALTKNWVLRANMNYRYTFNNTKEFEHSYLINRDFRMGFGYQF